MASEHSSQGRGVKSATAPPRSPALRLFSAASFGGDGRGAFPSDNKTPGKFSSVSQHLPGKALCAPARRGGGSCRQWYEIQRLHGVNKPFPHLPKRALDENIHRKAPERTAAHRLFREGSLLAFYIRSGIIYSWRTKRRNRSHGWVAAKKT